MGADNRIAGATGRSVTALVVACVSLLLVVLHTWLITCKDTDGLLVPSLQETVQEAQLSSEGESQLLAPIQWDDSLLPPVGVQLRQVNRASVIRHAAVHSAVFSISQLVPSRASPFILS